MKWLSVFHRVSRLLFQQRIVFDGVLFHKQMEMYSADNAAYQTAKNNIKEFCVDSFNF